MTRILLIATGGTIASRPSPDGVTVALSGAEVLDSVPATARFGVDVSVVDLAQGASWNLDLAALVRVVRTAREALAEGAAAGVVITHGTDGLEETAFLAHLLAVQETKRGPIVVTGAMRNAGEVGGDGPRNLADALAVAIAPDAAGRGALVVMNSEVHSARWVTKTDTSSPATFRSPTGMPVGSVDARGAVRFLVPPGVPRLPPAVTSDELDAKVAVVAAHAGVDGDVVHWHLDRGAEGIVVIGTGAGNVAEALVPGIERAIAAGVPVVVSSRAVTGRVAPIYGGPGGHLSLHRLGVLSSGDLGWPKARLALQVALANNLDVAEYLAALGA